MDSIHKRNIAFILDKLIDNLYRGKKQVSEELLDLLNGKLGYYYLEFDEGQKIEFWSSGFNLKKKNMATSI